MGRKTAIVLLLVGLTAMVVVGIGLAYHFLSPPANRIILSERLENRSTAFISTSTQPTNSQQESDVLVAQLRSLDSGIRQKAVQRLQWLQVNDQTSFANGLPQWIEPLVDAKQYQDVEQFTQFVIDAGWIDTPVVQAAERARLVVLKAEGKSEQASIEAASYKLEDERRFVMSVCTDLTGCLWVGTENGGIQRYNPALPKLQQWTQFTTKDGLGDDYGYAIACDHEGRIWAGHLNHGVSVYNGQKWQNYDVVGGIDRPDSLSGPLGERVFHITVCPTDGDVWIATNAGLSRYCDKQEKWVYYTRAEGLPSDQANSLAFDKQGNIYVATQCNGIAMADATDGYQHWRNITGPEHLPTDPAGTGLPTNLLNDCVVSGNGTVYLATSAGLAWSNDRGENWHYGRGADWGDKVRNSASGPPAGWTERPGATLAEDYGTCLFEDPHGVLYLGYREQHSCQRVLLHAGKLATEDLEMKWGYYVTSLAALPNGQIMAGTYGDGVVRAKWGQGSPDVGASSQVAAMPLPARPPALAELNQELAAAEAAQPLETVGRILPLDDDWRAQGAWLGRRGRYWSWLAAIGDVGIGYLWGSAPERVPHEIGIGPHGTHRDMLRYWIGSLFTDDPSALEIPPLYLHRSIVGKLTTWSKNRRQAEWDDHGEDYAASFDGPGIWITLKIPPGVFVVSIYEVNDDAHVGLANRFRDYRLIFSASKMGDRFPGAQGSDDIVTTATERVCDFRGGVYKRCVVQGPISLLVRLDRNFSFNTIFNAVMLDPPDEKIVGYDMLADEWKSLRGNTEFGTADEKQRWTANHKLNAGISVPRLEEQAAEALLQVQEEMPRWNLHQWVVNNKKISMLLARWYCSRGPRSVSGAQTAMRGTALYEAGLYPEWEQCLDTIGRLSPRRIEKALRWDGITGVESGHGYDHLRGLIDGISRDQELIPGPSPALQGRQ